MDDFIYLKLQSYIQTSIAARSSQKLSYKYFGPYRILQKVGNVAYKLELPADAKIHPVVHVFLLKKHVLPCEMEHLQIVDARSAA